VTSLDEFDDLLIVVARCCASYCVIVFQFILNVYTYSKWSGSIAMLVS